MSDILGLQFRISPWLEGIDFSAKFYPTRSNEIGSCAWDRNKPTHVYKFEFGLLHPELNTTSLSVPIVAHEAFHAAVRIVSDDWKVWAPRWVTPHRKEETTAWVVECIVGAVLRSVRDHNIPLSYDLRNINRQPK